MFFCLPLLHLQWRFTIPSSNKLCVMLSSLSTHLSPLLISWRAMVGSGCLAPALCCFCPRACHVHLSLLQAPGIRVLILLWLLCASGGAQWIVADHAARPATLKIGALLAPHSTIGREAKRSLELAVKHVNANRSVLHGTALELVWGDTNCSAFQGASAAMDLMSEPVVAIAGPQTSVVSHFVAHMGAATHVPLVSFSATDPSLSEYEYPYFVRLSCSDRVQMEAIAGVVGLFGWREVVALYSDDDFGTSGISALSDALLGVGATIVNHVGLDPAIGRDGIGSALTQLAQMGSRILVVHMQPIMGRILFNEAHYLKMTSTGYVWIVTEALSSVLDNISLDDEFLKATQGLIGTRTFIPVSKKLQMFLHEWKQLTTNETAGRGDTHITTYGLYAYDTIWLIAHALHKFFSENRSFTFYPSNVFPTDAGGNSELAKLNVSQNGFLFLQCILDTEFTGVTGKIKLDKKGDLEGSSIEIVNMVGRGLRTIGYWTSATGCTRHVSRLANRGTLQIDQNNPQELDGVIWPGGSLKVPHEWVIPNNGKPLLIGVPNKTGYKEFVDITVGEDNTTSFHGFCTDVFLAALTYLPYSVPYTFVAYGNGNSTPNYDDLVEQIANKEFDAVVGDVTITTKRARIVDFTQPYTTSGLAVVVPVRKEDTNHAWAFMRPFTPAMWCITCVFFLCTGVVVWLLEHKKNRDFRGRPKKQFVTTLWFIFSTLFFSQREDVKSTLGRAVLVIWLFVVLIITSSYTASLTSILTVQQLMPTIQGIAGLIASSVPIGYQAGSFVEDYLLQLNVPKERLVPLDSLASYAAALSKGPKAGGVGAIVDELPYVQLFLSSECQFAIAGQEFTKSGWGFVSCLNLNLCLILNARSCSHT
ncbi:hypothetical protein O6H91_Y403300 [Diphasiastrum complanatum]|nr:hypothetical protein O6H91_Y403300 [Diphasiastrum complanatum]